MKKLSRDHSYFHTFWGIRVGRFRFRHFQISKTVKHIHTHTARFQDSSTECTIECIGATRAVLGVHMPIIQLEK